MYMARPQCDTPLVYKKEVERKIKLVFTNRKGLKIDTFEFLTRSLSLPGSGQDLKSGNLHFQTLLPYLKTWSTSF